MAGIRLSSVAVVALSAALVSTTASAQWKPQKPITVIVPWPAGGPRDEVTRVVAIELEKALSQKLVVINQPGAAGSVGTKHGLDAPKDGYTWVAGAAQDLGAYRTLGMIDTSIGDWHLFLHVANIAVVGVNANTPYKSMAELLDAMRAKPGQITVATGGVTSSGHNAMEAISRATGVKYRQVTYDGGLPAVLAAVGGETEATTQPAAEQAEMIRARRLRPLAAVSDRPIEIEGYGSIEPITHWVPGFKAATDYLGIFIPKGVPKEVVATVEKIWADKIFANDALRRYALSRGALFAPVSGEAAQKAAFPAVQANAWQMFDSGRAKLSPDKIGIPRP